MTTENGSVNQAGEVEDAKLLKDANSWYSSVQLEEIARDFAKRECKIADELSRHDDWQKHRHAEYVAEEIADAINAALAIQPSGDA